MTVKGDFEVIAKGAFADGSDNDVITEVYTVRISGALMEERARALTHNRLGEAHKKLGAWDKKLCEMVVGVSEGVTVTFCLEEVFTLTHTYLVGQDGQEVEA